MTAFPAIAALIIFVYVRPHEFVTFLKAVPFLYLFLAWAIGGMFSENAKRTLAWRNGPWTYTKWALFFTFWCVFTVTLKAAAHVANTVQILVSLVLYFVMAYGIQTLRNFKRVTVVLFACGLFVAAVGFHQRFQPFQCIGKAPKDHESPGAPDGRFCTNEKDGLPYDGRIDCYQDHRSTGLVYTCEHVGLFTSTSVGGGRVRYIGVLADPNELSLATSVALPFAFAFLEERRTWKRMALLIFSLLLIAAEVAFTQSRGGQLVFGAVLGAYFVKRYGVKRGAFVGAMMVAPLIALGGRSGADVDQSTIERLEAAAAGIRMCMTSPIWGQGFGEFTQHHKLTAHNAYMLSAGELGLVGMTTFLVLLMLALKVPIQVIRFDFGGDVEAQSIKTYAMAMLAAFVGTVLGILFLSWTYHYILWMHFGLAASLFGVVKARHRHFEVKVRWIEIIVLFLASVAFLVAEAGYIMHKHLW